VAYVQEITVDNGLAAAVRQCPVQPLAPAKRGKSEEAVRRLLIWIALYSIPIVLMLRPVTDPDLWWHLRTGQWIVEHGTVPTTDPFSIYGQDKPWLAYSWLFELMLYGQYHWLGLTGILLLRIILSLAVLVAVHWSVARHEPRFVAATMITGLAFLALGPVLSDRPWLFSILFCVLTLEAVRNLRSGPTSKAVWLLPLCYVLWANLHIQFVYGLFLLTLGCTAPLLDTVFAGERKDQTAAAAGSPEWWKLVGLTGACLAATLVNPYHVRVYAVVLEYGTQSTAYQLIEELQALEFRSLSSWAVLALAGIAAFALGRRQRLSAFDFLLLGATAYFSFHSRRDLWFVVLAGVSILGTGGPQPSECPGRWSRRPGSILLAGGGVALVLVLLGWRRHLLEDRLEEKVADTFPARAAEVVERRGYAGPLYNDINWGGYLIWRLPGLPVCYDGRMNLHGDKRIQRHAETRGGLPGWDADPDLAGAGVVLVPARVPLASLLRGHPRFQLVHEDPVALVFITNNNHSRR
jgi:hypothetical protein